MRKISLFVLVIVMAMCCILPGCNKEQDNRYESLYARGNFEDFQYGEASADCYGYVLKQPLLSSGLICCYSALVDEFIDNYPGYDSDMPVQERIEFRKKVLEEIDPSTGEPYKKALQRQAVKEYENMMILYVRSGYKDMGLNQEKITSIERQWQNYGIQYYNTLKDIYPDVETPDDAMIKMTGCNIADVITYTKMQTLANDLASAAFYDLECTNEDFEKHYNEHLNDYRLVDVRAVYFADQASAEAVRDLMEKCPEDIDNLAKAYNGKEYLAETNGMVSVNSRCNKVPEAVKQWAYAQTEETLFEKHGKIELLQAEDGWYLLMCEAIRGFGVELGDTVYQAVARDYKSMLMDGYIAQFRALQEYELRSMDYDKAYKVLDEVY